MGLILYRLTVILMLYLNLTLALEAELYRNPIRAEAEVQMLLLETG
jgi:hypothetical protein